MSTRIVVVEDEVLIAYDIQDMLVALGYEVAAIATSDDEALQAVEDHHPDLVLMDIHLKRGDGVATAQEIRARRPAPIVFLTSYCDRETIARARAAGPYGYVLKPFHERELQAAVEVALERHALERHTAEKAALLQRIVSSMPDAVIAADGSGNILLLNEAARRTIGPVARKSVPPQSPNESGVFLADQKTPCPEDALPLTRALRGEEVRDLQLFVRSDEHPEGRWQSVSATPLRDSQGNPCGGVAVCRDVTDVKQLEESLRQLSDVDAMTGAYNRRGFLEAASEQLTQDVAAGRAPCLFFIDLNGLKQVNDTYGHPQGDQCIMDAAEVVRGCFRKSDVFGRLGGDEFVVLVSGVRGDEEEAVRARLQAKLDEFNTTAGRRYRLSMSVGTCRYEAEERSSLQELVEAADARMYEEKERRRRRREASGAAPAGPAVPAEPERTWRTGNDR